MRWRVAHHTVGYGHVYQGRFKSFPIERDEHLLTVCRYVERNALTAGAAKRAEDWRWSSLYVRTRPGQTSFDPYGLADAASGGLDRARECAIDAEGDRPDAAQHQTRPPVRRRQLDRTDCIETRS